MEDQGKDKVINKLQGAAQSILLEAVENLVTAIEKVDIPNMVDRSLLLSRAILGAALFSTIKTEKERLDTLQSILNDFAKDLVEDMTNKRAQDVEKRAKKLMDKVGEIEAGASPEELLAQIDKG